MCCCWAIGGGGGGVGESVAVGARLPEHGGDGLEEAVLGDAGADARVAHRSESLPIAGPGSRRQTIH